MLADVLHGKFPVRIDLIMIGEESECYPYPNPRPINNHGSYEGRQTIE